MPRMLSIVALLNLHKNLNILFVTIDLANLSSFKLLCIEGINIKCISWVLHGFKKRNLKSQLNKEKAIVSN
jgi:hypothetical protein